jgi:hypothetical protein
MRAMSIPFADWTEQFVRHGLWPDGDSAGPHVAIQPSDYGRGAAQVFADCAPRALLILADKGRFFRHMWSNPRFSPFVPRAPNCRACKSTHLVRKPVTGFAGAGVEILPRCSSSRRRNGDDATVTMEYVEHDIMYVGHFLVRAGRILHHTCFRAPSPPMTVKRGAITDYAVCDACPGLDIFAALFADLRYSGFACADFAVRPDGRVAIFEINPRLGGSLVHDDAHFAQFLQILNASLTNK